MVQKGFLCSTDFIGALGVHPGSEEIMDCKMDLGFKDHNNSTHTKNTSAATKNFSAWEDYKSSVDDMQYFLIGLYTLISLAGFVGNLLILMALLKGKQKTVINILIGNLAFSDILVVLFCSPFTLTSVLLDQWMFGSVMCHVMPFLQCASVLVSTLMLISIAAVRYRMIKYPLSSNLTAKQGYFLIVIIWAFGFTICSPLPVFHKTVDLSKTLNLEGLENRLLCIESWPSDSYRIAFTIALLFMQYILPLACLTASHTSVCRSIVEKKQMPWHVQVTPEPARVVTMAERRSAWADTAVNLVRLWSLWFPRVPWQQGELCMAAMGPEQLLPQQAAQNPCRGALTPAAYKTNSIKHHGLQKDSFQKYC
ncbi:Neuropeptide Y receptor type 5 [Lonchura striata]|uniref:Neuropeptide Y receptor type 5 n=1 Tax=Lonchura striata TaxID=40157 RepID=A0A218UE00_9PASE|nr:Neuropeptide Y receptor type 5 [Lonchura striata domestica]